MSAGTTTAPPGHWYPSAQQHSPSPFLIIPPHIKSNMEKIWQRRKQVFSRLSKEGQPEHPLFCSLTRCPLARKDSRNPTEELAQEYMLDYTLALAGSPHQGPRSTIVTECHVTPLQSPGVRVALVCYVLIFKAEVVATDLGSRGKGGKRWRRRRSRVAAARLVPLQLSPAGTGTCQEGSGSSHLQ
jgi:hypothetical protein